MSFLKTFITPAFISLFVAIPAYGAELYFNLSEPAGTESGIYEAVLLIDPEGENINALRGNIVYPTNILSLKDVHDGGSVVNIWLETPAETEPGVLRFSGIIPGGFGGVHAPFESELRPGTVLTLVFEGVREERASVFLEDTEVLLNDGRATPALLATEPLAFEAAIAREVSPENITAEEPLDNTPPEPFESRIANTPELFEGRYFLVFLTQDKDSGIDHYEVLESETDLVAPNNAISWVESKSPYVLKDQTLKSYVYVKAVDKQGNERMERIFPQNMVKWYENARIMIISVFVVIVLLLAFGARRFMRE